MPGVEGELDDEDIEAAMDLRYGSRSHEYDLGAQAPIDKQEDSSIDIQEDSSIAVGNDDSIEDAGAVGFVENAGVSADEHFVGKTGVSADEHFVGKTGVSANGPNGTAGVDEEDSSDEESEMHSATNDEERFRTHSAIFTATKNQVRMNCLLHTTVPCTGLERYYIHASLVPMGTTGYAPSLTLRLPIPKRILTTLNSPLAVTL
jgi:hypothetical protein